MGVFRYCVVGARRNAIHIILSRLGNQYTRYQFMNYYCSLPKRPCLPISKWLACTPVERGIRSHGAPGTHNTGGSCYSIASAHPTTIKLRRTVTDTTVIFNNFSVHNCETSSPRHLLRITVRSAVTEELANEPSELALCPTSSPLNPLSHGCTLPSCRCSASACFKV